MKPSSVKTEAQALRRQGLTYLEIGTKLSITIPKSTLSGWCREISLTKVQQARIQEINLQTLASSRQKALLAIKNKRAIYLAGIKTKYMGLANKLKNDKNSAIIALALLQLTEGGKQPGRLMFGNSDPIIIELFLKLLRKCYMIDETKFRCTVQCRADQNINELEIFWSKVTEIPHERFYPARIDSRSYGKTTLKPEYKGVCRLDYFSANIYNELQVIAEIISS